MGINTPTLTRFQRLAAYGSEFRARYIDPLFAKLYRFASSPRRLLAAVLLDWIVCATAYGFIEKKGAIASLWWVIVTGFTVGYGDLYPSTVAGRLVGGVVMVSCWLFLSLLLAHILTAFMPDPNVFTHEEQELLKNGMKELLTAAKKIKHLLYAILGKLAMIIIDLKAIRAGQAANNANQRAIMRHLGIEDEWRPVTSAKNATTLVKH